MTSQPELVADSSPAPRFSLVVPVFDEEDNVGPLLDEVSEVLGPHGPFETLLVDDASKDESVERILKWRDDHSADWLRLVRLEKNAGQSAAVLAGAERARGPIVVTMDGDMQNDPRDLVKIVEMLETGECAGVTGIRAKRRDSFVRRASSKIANWVRNKLTGDQVADSGCGIKGFRREVFLTVPRFNGMHRFMATLARYRGAEVREIEVNHRPRVAGEAKYGVGNRAWRGLKDCFALRWLRSRMLDYKVEEEA